MRILDCRAEKTYQVEALGNPIDSRTYDWMDILIYCGHTGDVAASISKQFSLLNVQAEISGHILVFKVISSSLFDGTERRLLGAPGLGMEFLACYGATLNLCSFHGQVDGDRLV